MRAAEKRVALSFRLPPKTLAKLMKLAAIEMRSTTNMVEVMIEQRFAAGQPEEAKPCQQ